MGDELSVNEACPQAVARFNSLYENLDVVEQAELDWMQENQPGAKLRFLFARLVGLCDALQKEIDELKEKLKEDKE